MVNLQYYESKLIPADAEILFKFKENIGSDGAYGNIIGFSIPEIYDEPNICILYTKINKSGNNQASLISITDEYCQIYKSGTNPLYDSAYQAETENGQRELLLLLVSDNGSFVTCNITWNNITPVVRFLKQ